MKQRYHTIIIGAGIAGLSAARFLNKDALVLDRKRKIGYPIQCGEGISKFALKREGIQLDPKWVRTKIKHIKRIMPNGKHIGSQHSRAYAYIINKAKFEEHLAKKVRHPIKLNEGVKNIKREKGKGLWKVITGKNKIYYTKHIIGADGPYSLVNKKIFKNESELINAIEYEYILDSEIDSTVIEMYIGEGFVQKGYAWIFPTSNHSANIGILSKNNNQNLIANKYNTFLKKHVKSRYGIKKRGKSKSGTIPVGGFFTEVEKENCFLVGDAGSFTDPIFEGGMNIAMYTGRIAAQCINTEEPLLYQKKIDNLPFTGQDLYEAQRILYNFNDKILNSLGTLLHDHDTDYLFSDNANNAFIDNNYLKENKDLIIRFATIWQKSKKYLW